MQISVIIPTYQPQAYLWQCLDSLAGQTLPKDQWELILVVNGPQQPYWQQIQTYLAQHASGMQVQVLYSDPAGVSLARNMALDHAQGDYIVFVDDDDYVSPRFLEELLEQASTNVVSLCHVHAFSEEDEHLPSYFENAYQQCAPKGQQSFTCARQYFSSSCLKLIHRDIIGTRRFNTHYRNGEDSLFMFLISDRLSSVRFTSADATYFRRVRSNSASTKVPKGPQIKNCFRLMYDYSVIFLHGGYSFTFYLTRILGAVHTILTR